MFGVGSAHETLPDHGITHLVEHLAMVPLHWTPYDSGAWVEDGSTTFWAEGSLEEVCRFLADVTGSLDALPLDRLDTERGVLAAEAAGRSSSYQRRLLALRFGPVGYGVGNYLELGPRRATAESVEEWRRRYFTAGNAAVWMTARPPDDLALDLPSGPALRPPEPTPIPGLPLPAQHAEWEGDVAIGMLARRTHALAMAGSIAERRAEDHLRMGLGLTYGVAWEYMSLTADVAHTFLAADCSDSDAVLVRDGIERVLEELAERGPTAAELAREVAEDERWMHEPGFHGGILNGAVENHLFGAPVRQPEEWMAVRRGLAPEAVGAALGEALATQIVLAPKIAGAARGRFAEHGRDLDPVEGTAYPEKRGPLRRPGWSLVAGADGVSDVSKGEKPATVRYDEVVALIEDRPGTFSVKSLDATTLAISPREVTRGAELERAVRERVPERLWVPLAANLAALGRLIEALDKPARVSAELDELPDLLGPTETPLALAEARRRRRRIGTVLATDRRLIWLYSGKREQKVELPWEAVTAVRLDGRTLVIEGGGAFPELRRVRPASAGRDIVQVAAERSAKN